jgi:hypothetical protein
MLQEITRLQSDFIKTVGRSLTPWIEMGFGNPLLWPTGAVVVEVADKATGQTYKLPLTATRIGNLILLTALRRDASWLQNLIATPDVRYWFAGQPRNAKALVVTPEAELPTDERAKYLLQWLRQQSRLTGWSFVVLAPRS